MMRLIKYLRCSTKNNVNQNYQPQIRKKNYFFTLPTQWFRRMHIVHCEDDFILIDEF